MRGADGRELASGALLVALGLFGAWSARGLAMGSGAQMGPGWFPTVLSLLLAGLGLLIAINGLRRSAAPSDEKARPVPWRALLLLSAAIVGFALAVRPLGLGPALAGAVGLACAASGRLGWRKTLVVTVLMTAGCWLVFVLLLRLPLPFLGPLLR